MSLCGREVPDCRRREYRGPESRHPASVWLQDPDCALRKDEEELKEPLRGWILEGKGPVREPADLKQGCADRPRSFLCLRLRMTTSVMNAEIVQRCRGKGILVNNASDASMCDFFFPSVVRDEEIVIGIAPGMEATTEEVKQIRKRIQDMLKGERRPK